MICPKCGSNTKNGAKFCMKCGYKFGTCAVCGYELAPDERFCRNCGNPVSGVESVAQETGIIEERVAEKPRLQEIVNEEPVRSEPIAESSMSEERPAKKGRSSRSKALLVVVCIVLIVALGAAGFYIWKTYLNGSDGPQALEEMFENLITEAESVEENETQGDEEIIEIADEQTSGRELSILGTSPTAEQQTIYTDDSITFTVDSFDVQKTGVYIYFTLKNNSDHLIVLRMWDIAINGYVFDMTEGPSLYDFAVESSTQLTDTFFVSADQLYLAGITSNNQIFSCSIKGDLETESYELEAYLGYTELKLDNPGTFVPDETGEILYDKNDIRIIYKGIETGYDFWFGESREGALLLIENNSDKAVLITDANMTIDGSNIGENRFYIGCDLEPGQRAMEMLHLGIGGIENIESIQEIMFDLCIYEEITYPDGSGYSEPIDTVGQISIYP